jgi:DNA (cytosine-5)-methyltransferase 1
VTLTANGALQSLIVPVEGREGKHAASAGDPLRTQSTRSESALLVPYHSNGVARPLSDPLGTMTTVDRERLVVPLQNHGVAKPLTHPIDTVSAEGNHHALLMRNNLGGAEMSTPVVEPMRTLTTGGHQSVLEPSEPISLVVTTPGSGCSSPTRSNSGWGSPATTSFSGRSASRSSRRVTQ